MLRCVRVFEGGWTDEAIGKHMGLALRTLQRWRQPVRTDSHRRKRQAEFDRYATYVRRRWEEGCHHGLTIWREIKGRIQPNGLSVSPAPPPGDPVYAIQCSPS